MASSTQNVRMGVCTITYNGVDLGYTKGGVEVSVATESKEITVDQFGKTPINKIIMARKVTVKAPLAETTLENLAAIMPGATLVRNAGNTPIRVDVADGTGLDLLSIAQELRLHPIGLPVGDTSQDFVVPLAATEGNISFAYKLEDERVFDIEFTGFPDSATKKLFHYGATA